MDNEGWIENTGVEPDFTKGARIDLKFPDGDVVFDLPTVGWDWSLPDDGDIVHWRYSKIKASELAGDGLTADKLVVNTIKIPAEPARNKYMREIKPGVWVDCYDVINAYKVTDPCLQHLLKKALAVGQRGHKDAAEDYKDILASAERAVELFEEWNK